MGHAPDWMRGSMAKGGSTSSVGPNQKFGVVSRELFHGAKTVQKFNDGGMPVEGQINEPVYADPLGAKISQLQDQKAVETASAKPAEKSDYSDSDTFGSAFSSARKAGLDTFTWNGKSYTTQMADKKPKAKSSSPAFSDDARSPDQVDPPSEFREEAGDTTRNDVRYEFLEEAGAGVPSSKPKKKAAADDISGSTYSVTPEGRTRLTSTPKPKAEPAPKTDKPSLLEALREGMRTTRK